MYSSKPFGRLSAACATSLATGVNNNRMILMQAICHCESSRAGESHPHALTDPDMNVAAHPALIVQPPPDAASASAQRAPGYGGQSAGSSARSAGDAAAGVY